VTERGKITVAIIVVLLLFIIPAIVITAIAWGSQQPPELPPQISNPDENDPTISDGPLPDGSGFNPEDSDDPDPSRDDNGEQGSHNPPAEPTPEPTDEDDPPEPTEDNPPEPTPGPTDEEGTPEPTPEPSDSPEFGPVNISRASGTMSFRYSPENQDSLDEGTINMLSEFISSPRNTSYSQISIEIPRLPSNETSVLKSAITEAFADHDIAQSRLVFAVYSPLSGVSSHEVKMSFVPVTTHK